jgi:hypothetical protein
MLPRKHLKEPYLFEFRGILVATDPIDRPLPSRIRPCHRISPDDEVTLVKQLLERNMCVLLPEEAIPKNSEGQALRGGLFCVRHKPQSDRLINDRRVLSELESRLGWITLPYGPQLCQLVVHENEVVLGSGDDLQNYFHCLRHHPSWWACNAFTRPLPGHRFVEHGADPNQVYRACFKTICMGGRNAGDIAHQVHAYILSQKGALRPPETASCGRTVPPPRNWTMLYIDDFWSVSVVPKSPVLRTDCPTFLRHQEITRLAREAYVEAGLDRAPL